MRKQLTRLLDTESRFPALLSDIHRAATTDPAIADLLLYWEEERK